MILRRHWGTPLVMGWATVTKPVTDFDEKSNKGYAQPITFASSLVGHICSYSKSAREDATEECPNGEQNSPRTKKPAAGTQSPIARK